MQEYNNLKTNHVVRVNKSKIKINASLTAICTKLGVVPTRVLTQFNRLASQVPLIQQKFYVSLYIKDNELVAQLMPNNDSQFIRQCIKRSLSKPELEEQLIRYSKQTLLKSNSYSIDKRLLELKGIYKSFNKVK